MTKIRFAVTAAAVMLSLSAVTLAAQHMFSDVSGKWMLTTDTPNGASNALATMKQAGDSLSGQLDIEQMGVRPFSGVVKGDTVRFWFSIDMGGQSMDIRAQGLLTDKDNMAGQMELAGMGAFPFVAKRQP